MLPHMAHSTVQAQHFLSSSSRGIVFWREREREQRDNTAEKWKTGRSQNSTARVKFRGRRVRLKITWSLAWVFNSQFCRAEYLVSNCCTRIMTGFLLYFAVSLAIATTITGRSLIKVVDFQPPVDGPEKLRDDSPVKNCSKCCIKTQNKIHNKININSKTWWSNESNKNTCISEYIKSRSACQCPSIIYTGWVHNIIWNKNLNTIHCIS